MSKEEVRGLLDDFDHEIVNTTSHHWLAKFVRLFSPQKMSLPTRLRVFLQDKYLWLLSTFCLGIVIGISIGRAPTQNHYFQSVSYCQFEDFHLRSKLNGL